MCIVAYCYTVTVGRYMQVYGTIIRQILEHTRKTNGNVIKFKKPRHPVFPKCLGTLQSDKIMTKWGFCKSPADHQKRSWPSGVFPWEDPSVPEELQLVARACSKWAEDGSAKTSHTPSSKVTSRSRDSRTETSTISKIKFSVGAPNKCWQCGISSYS